MSELLLLDRRDIEAVAPAPLEIIALAEATYRRAADVPSKIGVHPGGGPNFLHAMPAYVAPEALGVKWVSYYPGNAAARGQPDSTALLVLNRPEDGQPVAILEAMWLTNARTAACAAVAARHLARPDAAVLALVGCGGLGPWSLRYVSAVLPGLREVQVASRSAASRETFCAEHAGVGPWRLVPAPSVAAAVAAADVVVSATPQTLQMPVRGADWPAGSLGIALDVLSGWDDAAFAGADRLVTDGLENLRQRIDRFRPRLRLPARIEGYDALVAGRAAPRGATERILAIPTGVASLDVTLGWELYRRAMAAGRGTKWRMI